jgi:hypothetical protein
MKTAASVQRITLRPGSQNRGSGPYAPFDGLHRKGSSPGDASHLAATARRSPRRVPAAKPSAVLVSTTRGRRDTDAERQDRVICREKRCQNDNTGAPQWTTLEPASRTEVTTRGIVAHDPEVDDTRSHAACRLDLACGPAANCDMLRRSSRETLERLRHRHACELTRLLRPLLPVPP